MGFKYQSWLNIFLVFFALAKADAFQKTGYVKNRNLDESGCNLFSGKWIFDPFLNPAYDSSTCPFIGSSDCLKFGRPDKQYLKYSWKPTSCNLPRFDGAELLMRWMGKKIMFVGDSISLDQWTSLSCMLYAAVPKTNITFIRQHPISYVRFEDYDVTIFLHTSHYLVDIVKKPRGRILKLNSIRRQGKAWKGMDMLIFNTWHWWTFTGTIQEWDLIQDRHTIVKDMDRLVAFRKGLSTWARWVDRNIHPSKTKVFFRGISPHHYSGQEWGSNTNCVGEQNPINGTTYPIGKPQAAIVVKYVLSKLRTPVYLLDITTLSQLRVDAHPSIYTTDHVTTDCTHWCLPGLPDTWNQLLYAVLVA